MTSKEDEPYNCSSDTQSMLSSQFDQLNYARIHDSASSSFMTPTKRKKVRKTKCQDLNSSQDQDWSRQLTRSIRNQTSRQQIQKNQQKITKKYPKQLKNTKLGTVTVNIKNKSNEKYENVCAICLDQHSNVRATLTCGHKFCCDCLEEWTKTSTNCPCCRSKFKDFVKVTIDQNRIVQKRQIIKVEEKKMEYNELDYFICYVCHRGDDEDVLLICDICDFYCCHVYCDPSLRNIFPTGDWNCKNCKQSIQNIQNQPERTQIHRTQTVINTQRPITQTTRTLTMVERSQSIQSDSQSEQSENDRPNFRSTRRIKNQIKPSLQRQTRSKAFQMINTNHPSNRLENVINRITNTTAMNLRNLRRR